MTEERKQELRQLLLEARKDKDVVIKSVDRKNMSIDEYREYLQAVRKNYRPELMGIVQHYRPKVKNELMKSKLLNFIKEELVDYIQEHGSPSNPMCKNTIHPARSAIRSVRPIIGCTLNMLLEKFLEIAIAGGVEKAISVLDKCTRETTGYFQKIIFLQGLGFYPNEADYLCLEEINISEGIKLVRLTNSYSDMPPYLFDEKFSTVMSSAGPSIFQFRTLLVIDFKVSPLFCKSSNIIDESHPFQTRIKSTEFPNFNVDKFCQVLSLILNCAIEPVLEWQYIDEDELFNLRGGSPAEILERVMPSEELNINKVHETHINKTKCLYDLLDNLNSETQEKLQIPIGRWIQSKTSQTAVDKIIDLGIAFEALYLLETDYNREIRFRFSLHAAWHLGRDKAHREELMKEFKAIYDWRSTVVHTGKLPKKARNTPEEVEAFITNAQNLCRNSIMKILEDGKFPDGNNLILGEESS